MEEQTVVLALTCAGGSASNYSKWHKYLNAELVEIEYSGHWTRWNEPLYKDFYELMDDIYSISERYVAEGKAVYIYGHSMGGMVGYLLAKRINKNFKNVVKALFIAAIWAPSEINNRKVLSIEDCKIVDFIRDNRKLSEKVLKSDFFKEELFPMISNDFRIFCDCKDDYFEKGPLDIPIIAFGGNSDSIVSEAQLKKWQEYTQKSFECKMLVGNHYFQNEESNYNVICNYINSVIAVDEKENSIR